MGHVLSRSALPLIPLGAWPTLRFHPPTPTQPHSHPQPPTMSLNSSLLAEGAAVGSSLSPFHLVGGSCGRKERGAAQ